MSWQDAPVIQPGSPSVTPAWQTAPVVPVPTTKSTPKSTSTGDIAAGIGDAVLSGVSKVATGMVGAPIALANRLIAALTGGDGQMAADATHEYVNRTFGHDTQTPIGQHIGAAVASALAPIAKSGQQDVRLLEQGGQRLGLPAGAVSNQLSEASDIAGTAGLVAPLAAGASASAEAEAAAAAANPAARAGYRSAADHPIAAGAAGNSGTQALSIQNAQIANGRLGAEAGVAPGTALVPGDKGSLAAGRAAPGSVYDRLQNSLPTALLSSPTATSMMKNAGIAENVLTAPSATAQAAIDAQKTKLLNQPLTGPQVVQTSRALRQEGSALLGSDDVEQQKLGRAQLDIARALEQHIADTLPPGSTVDLPQFQAARTALAKNYALQGAVKGGNVDLQAVARMQQRDPDLLTGEFHTAAQFANEHPGVAQHPNRIEVPPSVPNDIGKAVGSGSDTVLNPAFWSRLVGGQGLARRILTGSPDAATQAARSVPVSGLGGEFSALPPGNLNLQPPPGQVGNAPIQRGLPLEQGSGQPLNPTGGLTASAPNVPPPAGTGNPSDIPFADLLSHGVEQRPAPGLSVAPMGSQPAGTGIPFSRNAAHEAGGLQLSPEDWLNNFLKGENNSDLAKVQSQGVPEDILQRARGGTDQGSIGSVSPEFANAQAADQAAGITRKIVDPDGRGTPISGVAARDVGIQGSSAGSQVGNGIAIEEVPGQPPRIINPGKLSPRLAQGLLNRYIAMRGLGGEF